MSSLDQMTFNQLRQGCHGVLDGREKDVVTFQYAVLGSVVARSNHSWVALQRKTRKTIACTLEAWLVLCNADTKSNVYAVVSAQKSMTNVSKEVILVGANHLHLLGQCHRASQDIRYSVSGR